MRKFAEHLQADPATATQDHLREYFLFLRQKKGYSRSPMNVAKCALCCFYRECLQVTGWTVFEQLRIAQPIVLPLVLSREEVGPLLDAVREARFRTCLLLIYHCGLRVGETVRLEIRDLQNTRADQPRLHVRNGTGGKDRYVPLAERTLNLLRAYRSANRSGAWLFPSPAKEGPISTMSLQKTFKAALKESGIPKNASIYTLRHSYATHLLERGVDIRLIQKALGHGCLTSTFRYTHLTRKTIANFQGIINDLMADL